MASVRNTGPVAVSIPSLGVDVAPGATFTCDGDVAAELCARPGFALAAVKPPAAKKATTPTTSEED